MTSLASMWRRVMSERIEPRAVHELDTVEARWEVEQVIGGGGLATCVEARCAEVHATIGDGGGGFVERLVGRDARTVCHGIERLRPHLGSTSVGPRHDAATTARWRARPARVLSWMAVRVSSMDGGATMLRGTEQGGAQQPTLVEGAPTPLLHSNVGVQEEREGVCPRATVEVGLWPPSHYCRSRREEQNKSGQQRGSLMASTRRKKSKGRRGLFYARQASIHRGRLTWRTSAAKMGKLYLFCNMEGKNMFGTIKVLIRELPPVIMVKI